MEVGTESAPQHDVVLAASTPEHRVQFYESEEFLAGEVAEFVAGGLTVGQPVVVIATRAHRVAFARRLQDAGFDVNRAVRSGQLVQLDARTMLGAFMTGATPDPCRFEAAIGSVVATARARGGEHDTVRLYGEMVDLLWKEGNTDGAIRVEELWNELARSHPFSLLCAYAMGNFYRSADAHRFQEICRQHTHVMPTERYVDADAEARLVEIAFLQQRARSLEAEVRHRRELEQRLRDTLAARTRAEEALRRRESELSELLAERERLLAAERAARAEAEAANRAKSQFLAVMSHELRTPLNAIAGHLQILELGIHGMLTDAQRDALVRIDRSQQRLLRLINDVLNLSRVETGRVEYVMENVAVQEVVAELVPMIEPQLATKGLAYEERLPPEPLVVRADREKLAQVLLNLLSNAIKFTPAGGRISIDASARAGELERAFVRVIDTGVGIPPEKQEAIFEPFVQVDQSLTRQREGSGLGLAISRDLTRGMGGELLVRSDAGAGSTFTITLRRARVDAPAPAA